MTRLGQWVVTQEMRMARKKDLQWPSSSTWGFHMAPGTWASSVVGDRASLNDFLEVLWSLGSMVAPRLNMGVVDGSTHPPHPNTYLVRFLQSKSKVWWRQKKKRNFFPQFSIFKTGDFCFFSFLKHDTDSEFRIWECLRQVSCGCRILTWHGFIKFHPHGHPFPLDPFVWY